MKRQPPSVKNRLQSVERHSLSVECRPPSVKHFSLGAPPQRALQGEGAGLCLVFGLRDGEGGWVGGYEGKEKRFEYLKWASIFGALERWQKWLLAVGGAVVGHGLAVAQWREGR